MITAAVAIWRYIFGDCRVEMQREDAEWAERMVRKAKLDNSVIDLLYFL